MADPNRNNPAHEEQQAHGKWNPKPGQPGSQGAEKQQPGQNVDKKDDCGCGDPTQKSAQGPGRQDQNPSNSTDNDDDLERERDTGRPKDQKPM